ncbi:MAG: hypothetical protein IKY66_05340 [Bacteroidales bacterium]|nr:hypothetical protein [Bacteroidales bacterium]
MDGKLEARIKTAIRENIASHEVPDDFFGNTNLGFKRFEVLYGVGFAPKCSETMRTIIVAVKHKDVMGDNVTVFEIKDYTDGKMVAMFDGNASIDFENKKVNWHNVCYGGFTREHADYFFQRMFESMEIETL